VYLGHLPPRGKRHAQASPQGEPDQAAFPFLNHQTILFLSSLRESAFEQQRAPSEPLSWRSLIILSTFFFTVRRGSPKLCWPILCLAVALMPLPPKSPERFPLLEHAGVTIEPLQHFGFSTPARGIAPKARMLYGARNPQDNERHWRSSYEEIVALIERNFAEA
jgi:hypothetical protein